LATPSTTLRLANGPNTLLFSGMITMANTLNSTEQYNPFEAAPLDANDIVNNVCEGLVRSIAAIRDWTQCKIVLLLTAEEAKG
jgi:hypothetical protein